jgi:hypothetical protein
MGGISNIGRHTITNMEDPSDAHDAVNKQYVDNNHVNVSNFKLRLIGIVRLATLGLNEFRVSTNKPVPKTVKVVILFQTTNFIRENIAGPVVPQTTSDGVAIPDITNTRHEAVEGYFSRVG